MIRDAIFLIEKCFGICSPSNLLKSSKRNEFQSEYSSIVYKRRVQGFLEYFIKETKKSKIILQMNLFSLEFKLSGDLVILSFRTENNNSKNLIVLTKAEGILILRTLKYLFIRFLMYTASCLSCRSCLSL